MKEKWVFPDPGNTDLNLYRCGIEDCAPGHVWGPGVRDHYLVHLVLAGSGTFRCGGELHRLGARDAFLIPPGEVVEYRADPDDPWSYAWVGFHGFKAEGLLRDAGVTPRRPVFRIPDDGRLPALVRRMLDAADQPDGRDARLLGLLYLFLAELAARPGVVREDPRGARQDEYLRRALADVAMGYAGPLAVSDLARRAGLDRSYLYSLFMDRLGVSPKDYIARFRVERACTLLRQPLSVAEVARSVGFEDAQVFTRTFRRIKGTAPSRWRGAARSALALALSLLLSLAAIPAPFAVAAGSDPTPSPSPTPPPFATTLPIRSTAASVLVVDLSRGVRLYEKDPALPVELSALNKAMTALIALESYAPETMVTLSKLAESADAGKLGLRKGEKAPLEYLVLGLMLQGSDAAAIALAEQVAGEEADFVPRMNEKAAAFGMTATVFANATGQPAEGQTTTVEDAVRFFRKALGNAVFAHVFSLRDAFYTMPDRVSRHLTNRLDSAWAFVDALTGGLRADAAGVSLAFSAAGRGYSVLCVAAGGQKDRVPSDVESIATGCLDAYESATLVSAGQSYPAAETVEGVSVPLAFGQTVTYVRPVGVDTIIGMRYESMGRSTLPALKTQVMGKVVFDFSDGTSIAVDLFPVDDVWKTGSPIDRFRVLIAENRDIAGILAALLGLIALVGLLRLVEAAVRSARRRAAGQRDSAGRTRRR